jgi:hypothetical protein
MAGLTTAERRARLLSLLDDLWSQLDAAAVTGSWSSTDLDLNLGRDGTARLAVDADGRRHVLVPRPDFVKEVRLVRTGGVEVGVRHLLGENDAPIVYVDVACTRPDLQEVFTGLAADVCEQLAGGTSDSQDVILEVLARWRALLEVGADAWTRERCAGLFAELSVLSRLLDRDVRAVEWWSGPAGEAHDIRGPGGAIEIKATAGREGRKIRIHGADQLEEPPDGPLFLAWVRLVEDAARGMTMRQIIDHVRGRSADGSAFDRKLAQLGAPPAGTAEFDGNAFLAVEERWHRVEDGFPRIVPATLVGGAVPGGVLDVEYTVDLDTVQAAALVRGDPALSEVAGTL